MSIQSFRENSSSDSTPEIISFGIYFCRCEKSNKKEVLHFDIMGCRKKGELPKNIGHICIGVSARNMFSTSGRIDTCEYGEKYYDIIETVQEEASHILDVMRVDNQYPLTEWVDRWTEYKSSRLLENVLNH